MSADGNPGPMRSPTASIDSRRSFRNCAASRFTFNQFLVLGETPYCSTRVRRKFQLIRSAFGDGAIEALEEGKPRPRALNKTVFPRKALFFIMRKALGSPWVCIVGGAWTETQSEMGGAG